MQFLVYYAGMQGRTALHIAVIHGHSKCVGVLVTWVEEQGLPDNTIEIADDHVSICCSSAVVSALLFLAVLCLCFYCLQSSFFSS